jgi:hypothetical protein
MAEYSEPIISFLVLDFNKENDTRACLLSLRERVKFKHKIIYLHNGPSDYAIDFFKDGLVDQFIITSKNNGLGIGTRDLFAASHSPFSIYWQNDQILGRDFSEEEAVNLTTALFSPIGNGKQVASISLAGSPCGPGIYSERAHLINTDFYRYLEVNAKLGYHGAGPYHDGPWREEQIQKFYEANNFVHYPLNNPLAIDNGRTAERQNPDGSRWRHYPDTKQLWLIAGPIKEKFIYPKFTDTEWEEVLKTQSWPDGKIPEQEVAHSFHVWN